MNTIKNTARQTIAKLLGSWKSWLPTKGNVLFTLVVLGGLLWVTGAGAISLPAPRMVGASSSTTGYQGYLTDSNGNPVNS